jgi:hypothetical protein
LKAFVIHVNGKRLCTAGAGPDGVLSVNVYWAGGGSRHTTEDIFGFHVGGLDSRTDEHLTYATPQLKIGDEITVQIIETDDVDREARRSNREPPEGS